MITNSIVANYLEGNTTNYNGGHLEIFIRGRLHDICSSFVNVVVIAVIICITIRVGVIQDDVDLQTDLRCSFDVLHRYSHLPLQVFMLLQ